LEPSNSLPAEPQLIIALDLEQEEQAELLELVRPWEQLLVLVILQAQAFWQLALELLVLEVEPELKQLLPFRPYQEHTSLLRLKQFLLLPQNTKR